jgi:hypothetical protein
MSVRYRPMRASDVRECVAMVAEHPTVGPRYGKDIEHLGPALTHLLYDDAFCAAVVFEEPDGSRKLAVGISVFASDEFIHAVKTPPHFWVGPELARRVVRGQSPLLTHRQVRGANARGGLNLLIWQSTASAAAMTRIDVWDAIAASFFEYHHGYLWKELGANAETTEHLVWMRNAGGLLWKNPPGEYTEFWQDDLSAVIEKPHFSGMTRDQAMTRRGSWLASLFLLYQPPRFGFSRSEQRLLLTAMRCATDQEVSNEMSISLDTIRKTWRLIYDRVTARAPGLIPDSSPNDDGATTRGREKKQRLIAYLREHPEELRPISRKALAAMST